VSRPPRLAQQHRPSRRYASVPVAAEAIGCSPKTLRRRISDGTIPAYKLGRLVRVDMAEVEAAFVPIPTAVSS
jgi:excisionase family DNA binding protein